MVRYCGIANCLRILMLRADWCKARAQFDLGEERKNPASMFSSPLAERLCDMYIPGYASMEASQRGAAADRFLTTGQCCSEAEVRCNPPTVLLLIEQGADAFQPFKRRDHSTWVLAFRYVATHNRAVRSNSVPAALGVSGFPGVQGAERRAALWRLQCRSYGAGSHRWPQGGLRV